MIADDEGVQKGEHSVTGAPNSWAQLWQPAIVTLKKPVIPIGGSKWDAFSFLPPSVHAKELIGTISDF